MAKKENEDRPEQPAMLARDAPNARRSTPAGADESEPLSQELIEKLLVEEAGPGERRDDAAVPPNRDSSVPHAPGSSSTADVETAPPQRVPEQAPDRSESAQPPSGSTGFIEPPAGEVTPAAHPAEADALSQDLIEQLLSEHLAQSEPMAAGSPAEPAAESCEEPAAAVEPVEQPPSPASSDSDDALTPDLIEELLAKTIAEMESGSSAASPAAAPTAPAAREVAVSEQKPVESAAKAEPENRSDDLVEQILGGSSARTATPVEPAAAAPTDKPAPAMPKPKIDFAALRKSRESATQVNSAQVARLFGGPATDAPATPAARSATSAAASSAGTVPPAPTRSLSKRRIPRWERRLVNEIWRFRREFPLLWRGCEWLGIVLAFHGVLILTLALLGWI